MKQKQLTKLAFNDKSIYACTLYNAIHDKKKKNFKFYAPSTITEESRSVRAEEFPNRALFILACFIY